MGAIKMFSIVMPFGLYERLKAASLERDVSVGAILREGAELILKKSKGTKSGADNISKDN